MAADTSRRRAGHVSRSPRVGLECSRAPAGYTGLSAALHLAERGADVLVVHWKRFQDWLDTRGAA